MSTIRPELMTVLSVRILKSIIDTTDEYISNQQLHDGVEIQMGQQTALNVEQKNVRVHLFVHLTATKNETEPIGLSGEYLIEFIIHVANLEEFLIKSDNRQLIDQKLGGTLTGIVFSTARGIIFERTAATLFNGVILPIIDPNQLLIDNKQSEID